VSLFRCVSVVQSHFATGRTAADARSDLHEIIGPRLPNEIFFLLSQGVVNQQVLNNLISGVLPEAPPLMDSEEYRCARAFYLSA
jgi:hypothetical protein